DPFGLQARSDRSRHDSPGSWQARDDPATGDDDRKLHNKVIDRLAETRLPSLVAAVPGLGGAVTSRLPITMALGAVAQGLVLCAVADEHGVHDEAEVVALLGAVLFRRDLSPTPRDALSEATSAEVD